MGQEPQIRPDFRTATWQQTGPNSWQMTSPYFINPQHQLAAAEARAEYWKREALTDELTQVPNKKALNFHLASPEHNRADKSDRSILFIDLDGFKLINDTKGHAAGDKVLQAVAQKLVDALRDTDKVFRIGGDEFVCLLEGSSVEDTNRTVARRIEKILEQGIEVTLDNGEVVYARGSVGVFNCDPTLNDKENIARADAAMYLIKEQNKLAKARQANEPAVPASSPAGPAPAPVIG